MAELGTRHLVNIMDPEPFDPQKHVKFRGRPITELTRDELIEALTQALDIIHSRQFDRHF